jgi:hypothetical protein
MFLMPGSRGPARLDAYLEKAIHSPVPSQSSWRSGGQDELRRMPASRPEVASGGSEDFSCKSLYPASIMPLVLETVSHGKWASVNQPSECLTALGRTAKYLSRIR